MNTQDDLKLRILVADDDNLWRSTVNRFLQWEGHMVDEAADGADAWAQISIHDYDYVILDLHMPKLNGLELLRLMRKLSKPPRSIMLTGDKSEYVERTAQALGAIACYAKPVSLDELESALAPISNGWIDLPSKAETH